MQLSRFGREEIVGSGGGGARGSAGRLVVSTVARQRIYVARRAALAKLPPANGIGVARKPYAEEALVMTLGRLRLTVAEANATWRRLRSPASVITAMRRALSPIT